jgi:hypothetical protein
MSRWLSSVNTLLEKLDDRVENVVEERALANELLDDIETAVDNSIGDILTKRGLSSVLSKEEDDDDEEEDKEKVTQYDEENAIQTDKSEMNDDNNDETSSPQVNVDAEVAENYHEVIDDNEKNKNQDESSESVPHEVSGQGEETADSNTDKQSSVVTEKNDSSTVNEQGPSKKTDDNLATSKRTSKNQPQPPPSLAKVSTPTRKLALTTISSRPPNSTGGTPTRSQKEKELTAEMKEAQKEARTLRRHVVSLNEQLEAAENELQAQRKELERAAERMEKDRLRSKQEKESSQKQHAQEISLLRSQHEKTLKEQQARFEEQLDGYRQKLSEAENRRRQEGGNWTKEMSQAIEEQEFMRHKVGALEEEKAVLLSQISTLQGQQTALGSRLESLTQAADNAMERERDAEDRLDALLNQHARQISQRQVSFSEYESTSCSFVICKIDT